LRIDARVAAANPVSNESVLDHTGEALLRRIVASQRDIASPLRERQGRRLRLAVLVVVGLLAIGVPTVAVATHLDVLNFSNAGAPINPSDLSLDRTSGWKRAGVMDNVRRLGERAGLVFYAARGRPDNPNALCFSYAPASGGDRPGSANLMSCQAADPDAFPSAKTPILDLSDPMPPPYPHNYPREWSTVRRLAGVAADGVARVGHVGLDGVVHSTPVVDNLYATEDFGQTGVRATAIVALGPDGDVLYTLNLLG
jgi:hypothetical protein